MLFDLEACGFYSCHLLNLSSSLLLFLQFLFKLMAHSYHCSIVSGWCFNSMSLYWIVPFMSCLNYSINGHLSYLLSLIVLSNSCTNSFIIFPPCSSFLNSATLTISSSYFSSPNSLFKSAKNFPAVLYSNTPVSKFSSMFSFHILANPLCTYDNIY